MMPSDPLSPICQSTLCHKVHIQIIWTFVIVFYSIMYFQSHYDFANVFKDLKSSGNNERHLYLIFSAIYFEHPLFNWRFKFMELSNCLHSCRFYRTIILNYSSEVKQKLGKTLLKSADFSSHNLPKKTRHHLRLHRLVIPLLIKHW